MMTERQLSAMKGAQINDAINQHFQDENKRRFKENTILFTKNQEISEKIIDKLKQVVNYETKFSIFEKPKSPNQPEKQISLTNIEITDKSVIFSRNDNPEKRISMKKPAFCILVRLANRNKNGLLEENFDITSQWQLLPTTPKLHQTS